MNVPKSIVLPIFAMVVIFYAAVGLIGQAPSSCEPYTAGDVIQTAIMLSVVFFGMWYAGYSDE
jgi:hypothetical protein